MKKIGLLMFITALFFMSPSTSSAQIQLSLNLGLQPEWGPSSYDHVEYYYMPEMGIYYYAPGKQFVYRNGSRWVFTRTLPYRYRHVDLYSTYKVVVNEPRPYLRNNYYVSHYGRYRNEHSRQEVIRDSRDQRYVAERNRYNNSRNRMDMNRPNNSRDRRMDMNRPNNSRERMDMGPQHRNEQRMNDNRGKNDNRGNNNKEDHKGNKNDHKERK